MYFWMPYEPCGVGVVSSVTCGNTIQYVSGGTGEDQAYNFPWLQTTINSTGRCEEEYRSLGIVALATLLQKQMCRLQIGLHATLEVGLGATGPGEQTYETISYRIFEFNIPHETMESSDGCILSSLEEFIDYRLFRDITSDSSNALVVCVTVRVSRLNNVGQHKFLDLHVQCVKECGCQSVAQALSFQDIS